MHLPGELPYPAHSPWAHGHVSHVAGFVDDNAVDDNGVHDHAVPHYAPGRALTGRPCLAPHDEAHQGRGEPIGAGGGEGIGPGGGIGGICVERFADLLCQREAWWLSSFASHPSGFERVYHELVPRDVGPEGAQRGTVLGWHGASASCASAFANVLLDRLDCVQPKVRIQALRALMVAGLGMAGGEQGIRTGGEGVLRTGGEGGLRSDDADDGAGAQAGAPAAPGSWVEEVSGCVEEVSGERERQRAMSDSQNRARALTVLEVVSSVPSMLQLVHCLCRATEYASKSAEGSAGEFAAAEDHVDGSERQASDDGRERQASHLPHLPRRPPHQLQEEEEEGWHWDRSEWQEDWRHEYAQAHTRQHTRPSAPALSHSGARLLESRSGHMEGSMSGQARMEAARLMRIEASSACNLLYLALMHRQARHTDTGLLEDHQVLHQVLLGPPAPLAGGSGGRQYGQEGSGGRGDGLLVVLVHLLYRAGSTSPKPSSRPHDQQPPRAYSRFPVCVYVVAHA
jgi:hypothetical protein